MRHQPFVGLVAMANPEVVGLLTVPGHSAFGAGNFIAEAVFASRGDLRDPQRTVSPTFEAQKHRPTVIGLDLYRFGGFDIPDLARKSFNLTFRALADWVNGFQIGTNGRHFQTGNSLNQIEPMGADVGDSTQKPALLSQYTPVVIG